jgi:hypothetical protein
MYGQWGGVASAAANQILTAAGIPGGGLAAELVATMAGLGDAQSQLLASIKKDTKLLREEPYRTARVLLAEAGRVGPHDARHPDFIDRALESFYRAHSLAESARERAVVEFDIAMLYLVTGKTRDAQHWTEKSCLSCRAAVDGLVSGWIIPRDPAAGRIYDKRKSTRRNIPAALKRTAGEVVVGAALGLVFPVVLVSHPSRTGRRAKAVAAARDMVSFSNMVEHLTAQVGAGAAKPPLEIVEDPDVKKVYLRELEPPRGVMQDFERARLTRDGSGQPPVAAPVAATLARQRRPVASKSPTAPRRAHARTLRGHETAKILEALKGGESMTASEIAKLTEISAAAVTTTLTRMAKTGELVKAGRGYMLPG